MCAWEINLHSRKQNLHRFGTDDFALLEIGIGNYNLSSLATFFNLDEITLAPIGNKPPNPDVKEFFSNDPGSIVIDKLIGEKNLENMAIMAFDPITKTYTEVVGYNEITYLDPTLYPVDKFTEPEENGVRLFLEKWNNIQRGFEQNQKVIDGYKAVVYRIQNSMSGCITFNADLDILNQKRQSLIRLYLMDSSDTESSRTISFNGSPIITDFPKTVTGLSHSFGASSASGPGTYITPNKDDNNPQDKVAGKMSMVYDSSTGEWQSGTQQMLARLLTNVDPANVPELTPEQLESMNRVDNYESGVDIDLWLGGHTTGQAIPLSAENGNPYMFGPDYKDGCQGGNKVKITVINRFNDSYKAGQVVVVSKMAGENGNWVITSPGLSSSVRKKLTFGNFEYQQYIIPANNYFAVPGNAQRFLPDVWVSKIRDDYYINHSSHFNTNKDRLVLLTNFLSRATKTPIFSSPLEDSYGLSRLNIYASKLSGEEDDPIAALRALLDDEANKNIVQEANQNRLIDGESALLVYKNSKKFKYKPYLDEHKVEIGYPKNVLKRRISILASEYDYSTFSRWYPPDPVGALEVPIFWGMLFPDGYKANQTGKYKNLTAASPLYIDDPNLTELSVGATECAYDLGNTLQSLLFMRSTMPQAYNSPNRLQFIKKTGGCFFYGTKDILSSLYNRASFGNSSFGNQNLYKFETDKLINNNTISQLEPLNPAKIQFSSLSLEGMYAGSTLFEFNSFTRLKKLLDYTANYRFANGLNTLQEYAKKIIFNNVNENVDENFLAGVGNKYNIEALAFSNAFGSVDSKTFLRHSSPAGSIIGLDYITPSINGSPRLPAMPVITCKSTVTTTAESLVFTINENIGLMQKRTTSAGSVGSIAILPLLPPIALPIGGGSVAPSVNAISQWGGGDNIDSFGTTALHVKIYESVPVNQVVYLGDIFTPLHVNPSVPEKVHVIEYDPTTGVPNLVETDRYSISPVDFRVPTNNQGLASDIGERYTKERAASDIAPVSKWLLNPVRRGALLTGGGFAYYKPVFAIISVNSTPINKGSNYKKDEKFTYSDGSFLTVVEVGENGKIERVDFTNNISNTNELKVQNSDISGFSTPSFSASPTYGGGNGSGASFEILEIMIVNSLGYDRPPRSTNIVRLTSPNNNGNSDAKIGTRSTTIDLPESPTKKYDIFYFYHNDPSHYSIDESNPYNQGFAQHVISEVRPA